MKILLPFYVNNDEIDTTNLLESSKVLGGIERFSQLLFQHFEGEVIPLYYSPKDTRKKRLLPKLLSYIDIHQPDIIVSNQDKNYLTTDLQDKTDVPIVWITHTTAGAIFKIPQLDMMEKFVGHGGTLAMVSQFQYTDMNRLCNRVKKQDLIINGGFINPAFCVGNETVSEASSRKYNIVTIGRIDGEKNPFLAHQLAQKNNLNSLILSSTWSSQSPAQKEYTSKHKHWAHPQDALYNLEHNENMDHLANSEVYFSTCPRETWGITALEAYSRGVPVILIRRKSNYFHHASEDIAPAPNENFFAPISSNKEFRAAYDQLLNVDRKKLSDMTKEKHSKAKWLQSFNNLIDKTIENHKKRPKPKTTSLNDFM